MRGRSWVCLFLVAACTSDNPLYAPGDGGDPRVDAAVPAGADLAGPADLATPATCSGDQRACSATASQRCVGDHFAADRACPSGSQCTTGYCGTPSMGMGTVGKSCVFAGHPTETQCITGAGSDTPSCQPFITGATGTATEVTWLCDVPVGTGNPAAACTQGSQCRSGFCGSNGTCFRACVATPDCPGTGPVKLTCAMVTLAVEGRTVSAMSCIPQ